MTRALKTTLFSVLILSMPAWTSGVMARTTIQDDDIEKAILDKLEANQRVPAHLLEARVQEGVATLEGTVSNLFQKRQALETAKSIRGVKSLVDEIRVRAVPRSDRQIKKDVETSLLFDPATDAFELEVEVHNGVVTLQGEVDSRQEKELCELVAMGARGAKRIENLLKVKPVRSRVDPEIKAEVERRIDFDVWLRGDPVQVEVEDGRVFLSGKVGSLRERDWAERDAWVAGVRDVDVSGLEIDPDLREKMERRIKHERRPDRKVRQAVLDAMLYDPRVNRFKVGVRVNAGIATLTGVVDNLRAKQAAGQDARNTVGVVDVKNHIRVRNWTLPGDALTRARIEDSFLRDPVVDEHQIDVEVRNGRVILGGQVDNHHEALRARELASRTAGVVDVEMKIRVNDIRWHEVARSDMEIAQDIRQNIWWNPLLDGEDISVDVTNGAVTLRGTVDLLVEKHAAAREAYDAGAREVHNYLDVREFDPRHLSVD